MAHWLGTAADRHARIEVGPDLAVPGHPEFFVVGDAALVRAGDGKPLPGWQDEQRRPFATAIAARSP